MSKVVVVTGSSAGLGRAIAHGFAKRGSSVGLIARNPEALNAARGQGERFCFSLAREPVLLPTRISLKISYQRHGRGWWLNHTVHNLTSFHCLSVHRLISALICLDDCSIQADTGEYAL